MVSVCKLATANTQVFCPKHGSGIKSSVAHQMLFSVSASTNEFQNKATGKLKVHVPEAKFLLQWCRILCLRI